MPFGGDQPAGIGAIALRHTVRIVREKKVRISTRKRDRIEGLTSGSSPLAMPLLLFLVRPIDEGGEDLDQQWSRRRPKAVASTGTREAAPLNSWVKRAHWVEAAVSIASTKTSMAALSSAGSQQVSMNTRCPFTIYGSYKVSEVP